MLSTNLTFNKYIHDFTHLRTDRTGGWTEQTRGRAPHKPFLLLSILDLFAQGRYSQNLIEITPELGEIFAGYWSRIMPAERRGNMALPFFHLRTSPFWHLIARPGMESTLQAIHQVDTLSYLNKLVIGAKLDEALYELLLNPEPRNLLRTVLIQTYFSPDIHQTLLAQGDTNFQAFLYSQHLLEQARKQIKDKQAEDETYLLVRDQGFRRAVVTLYEHRCAFCGVRMLTADGRTVVDAAHIIPWRISHNDDPHNGMALCRLCHWTFDEGLLGVSAKYLIQLSGELRSTHNVPGHLSTLENRIILGPAENELWPDRDALAWHRQKVFRK